MDPVTQGALGAAWAEPGARGSKVGWAAFVGCVAGMAPDLDFLIRSNSDPLLAIEFHRHFTHSLVFIPFGALLCALMTYPLARGRLSAGECYGFSLLGYASHGLLDACTGYGTLLLWPFSRERIAWDIVSVIDPMFSVPLIVLAVLAAVRRRPVFAVAGIAWCAGYLAFGVLQNHRAASAISALAEERGHGAVVVDAKPSLANLFLWRTLYSHDGRFYVDAVRVGLTARIFEGDSRPVLDLERDFPELAPESRQTRDIERFAWFAGGYLAVAPGYPNRIVDLRYALVPNSADAFWGIEIDVDAPPEQHAAYVTMRNRPLAEGRELARMLFR